MIIECIKDNATVWGLHTPYDVKKGKRFEVHIIKQYDDKWYKYGFMSLEGDYGFTCDIPHKLSELYKIYETDEEEWLIIHNFRIVEEE